MDFGLVGLTAEVPFVVNVKEDVHDLNLVPKLQVIFRYALIAR